MKKELVAINSWPESQYCMDCIHGSFIQGENYNNSDYVCSLGIDNPSELCQIPNDYDQGNVIPDDDTDF